MNAKKISSTGKGTSRRPGLWAAVVGASILVLGTALYVSLSQAPGRPQSGAGVDDLAREMGGYDYDEAFDGGFAETAGELLEYRMIPGKAYEYSFTRSLDAMIQGETMVDLELGGLVTPHVVRARDGRLDLIMHVRLDKTLGIDAEDLPARGRNPGAAPAYLAHLQIDRSGQPLFLRFDRENPDRTEQGIIRDVISTWLQPLPAPGARPRAESAGGSWLSSLFGFGEEAVRTAVFAVRGTDTQGLYAAALSLLVDEDASGEDLRYDLAKANYEDSLTPIKIQKSEHKIVWKIQHGVFSGSAGTDEFRMGASDFQVDSSLQYVYNLNDVSSSVYTEADLERFVIPGDIYDVESYLSDSEVEIPERTKPKPWKEIKPRLTAVTADMDGEERTEIFNTLAVSVRANPAVGADAARAARQYAGEDHRYQMVMGALSFSGSPAAQQELMGLFGDEDLDPEARGSVIDAFTLMDEPATPEAISMLQDAYAGDDPDLSSRAALALSSAQRNRPNEKLRQWILDEWRAAKSDEQRQTVLEYVGNSGDPKLMSIVKDALSFDDFGLQQLALNSTRFMDTVEVNSFLLEKFNDRSFPRRLRYEALGSLALHQWEERFLPIMENCVRQESMDAMRMRCALFTLEQLRHERRMKNLLRAQRATGANEAWSEFVDRETTD